MPNFVLDFRRFQKALKQKENWENNIYHASSLPLLRLHRMRI